ncbi:VOC family protein [Gracilibacillus alcaliphilus]|uniref:VOC family protein n=1 Tax=Gracilibacillus alcaliphilus TaxID=1401441 RepID=UPI001958AA14|nr:VOC family protein [Gracilibacillus alcaliphilus]MBM7675528.1 PhnB protein [Gracilibacillus alcaliphilus]
MPLNPYFMFNGNALEAIRFYEQAFQTEPAVVSTYGEMPGKENKIPEEAKSLVLHAKIEVDGTILMFSDHFPGSSESFQAGNNITIALVSPNVELIQHAFQTLQENGKVELELQETFWSKHYGKVTDKFGVHWQLSSE